jgi:hypothetical protein
MRAGNERVPEVPREERVRPPMQPGEIVTTLCEILVYYVTVT